MAPWLRPGRVSSSSQSFNSECFQRGSPPEVGRGNIRLSTGLDRPATNHDKRLYDGTGATGLATPLSPRAKQARACRRGAFGTGLGTPRTFLRRRPLVLDRARSPRLT